MCAVLLSMYAGLYVHSHILLACLPLYKGLFMHTNFSLGNTLHSSLSYKIYYR